MHNMGKRLLGLLLAALLAAFSLSGFTLAEDWRNLLRDAYGLSDDYDEGDLSEAPEDLSDDEAGSEDYRWELPITDPQQIVNYLSVYGELPENFITKKEAQALGWDSRYNYVGEVAPGKSIGGDRFGNYEGLLPQAKGRTWYECDANYKGKKRGAERIIFSSDGLYYYTNDHYQTFTEMFPEDMT